MAELPSTKPGAFHGKYLLSKTKEIREHTGCKICLFGVLDDSTCALCNAYMLVTMQDQELIPKGVSMVESFRLKHQGNCRACKLQ